MYQGKSIRLRPFERSDQKKYRDWVNNSEIASLVDRVLPVSDHEHEKWYSSIIENRNCVFFAIESIKPVKHIGAIWLWNIDSRHRKAELRVLIGESSAVNKGLGTEAIAMISSFAFNKLNLHRLYAYVLLKNARAIRAFEKAGFVKEGELREDRFIDGVYEDVAFMALI
ncbi:MAG: hypothetical protein CVV42_15845 [Candidatus Riflebacteria bacterium HGW-Riflebacteria-2]|jgi:RimJ/RimL family protein N-acetyltransferase|nr:MAG: hypothetical protein CVV42_15845 [Candidatus Riflebacteria bacterium HGW-Riflebacteria-2]